MSIRGIYKKGAALTLIPLLLLSIMSFVLYTYYDEMKEADQAELHAKFDLHVKEVELKVKLRIRAYEQLLYATRGLFEASRNVGKAEYTLFVDNLSLCKNFPGIQGLGYAVVVDPKNKEQFIQKARASISPDYTIKPDFKREAYTAIYYLEPLNWRNKRAIGYDMFSNHIRRQAMELARDEAKAVMSGKVTLVQETDEDVQAGFLIYLPLYEKNAMTRTMADRRRGLNGWIYAAFRARDFFIGFQGYNEAFFDIEIYDNGIIDSDHMLLNTKPNTYTKGFEKKIILELAGREWLMIVKSTPAFDDDHIHAERAELILFFGFIASLFFSFFMGILLYRKWHVEAKFIEVNKKLKDSKRKLEKFNFKLEQKVIEKTLALEETNEMMQSHIKDLESMNEHLKNAKAQALQAAQARSNFISGVSHELRTPLNAIINFTDQVIEDFDLMIHDDDLQDESKQFLERVMVNSRHLLQLINDLLEFTKAEAGKIDYDIRPHDLNVIIQNAHKSTYSLLQGIEVEMRLSLWAEPLVANVDSRRFLQILLNLLSNAIKFTEKGWIEIKSFKRDDVCVVEVRDTGRGINPQKIETIFDPFIQVNSYDPGTGLGLGLVKRMCDDMDIKISMTTVENEGTTFHLEIKS